MSHLRTMTLLDQFLVSLDSPRFAVLLLKIVKLPEPLLRIELEETVCWTLDWANSEVLAVGTTNGI